MNDVTNNNPFYGVEAETQNKPIRENAQTFHDVNELMDSTQLNKFNEKHFE